MIPNFVNPGFNFVEEKLYSFQRSFLVDENKVNRQDIYYDRPVLFGKTIEEAQTTQFTIVNRLLAVPVVVMDLALESVRPLFKAAESATFVFVSVGALFFHLLNPYTNERGKEIKSCMRITLLNFNNAVENTVFTIIKVVATPFLLLGQLLFTVIYPLTSQSSSQNFPVIYSPYISKEQLPNDPYSPYENNFPIAQKSLQTILYKGGIRNSLVIPIAIADALSEPFISIGKMVFSLQILIIGTIGAVFSLGWHLVTRDHEWETYEISRITLTAANNFVHSLSHAISKIALLPLTLVAQISASFWDSKHAEPTSVGLYGSKVNDRVLTIKGIQHIEAKETLA